MKSKSQKDFEVWAVKHKFQIEFDKELDIYTSAFTQGAWMAYREGFNRAIYFAINHLDSLEISNERNISSIMA